MREAGLKSRSVREEGVAPRSMESPCLAPRAPPGLIVENARTARLRHVCCWFSASDDLSAPREWNAVALLEEGRTSPSSALEARRCLSRSSRRSVATGAVHGDAPSWTWVPGIPARRRRARLGDRLPGLLPDPRGTARRPVLYALVPLASYLALVQLCALGAPFFWRAALAYLAIFHFVKQQAGWVALYRARALERGHLDRLIDMAAVYAATGYPLVFWHTHARQFDWFTRGDIVRLPAWLDRACFPLYVLALGSYVARGAYRAVSQGVYSPGKDLLIATTAMCWYVGIVRSNSDYAFTVMNVFIHGIPYIALIYFYGQSRARTTPWPGIASLLATIWVLAYVEELGWDRAVWGERAWLFGPSWDLGPAALYLVPLLAVPQVTHYVLDGFIWRRKTNPSLGLMFDRAEHRPELAAADARLRDKGLAA